MIRPANAPANREFVTVAALPHEPLDALAHRITGSTSALAELMIFNPHLTMTHLPAGTLVFVPQRTAAAPMRETVQLWS